VGALACQGGPKDGSPIGDYPRAGGGQSEEAEQEPREPDTHEPTASPQQPTVDSEHAAPGNMSPPFAADADAGPGFEDVDAAVSEGDAGEADAGVTAP